MPENDHLNSSPPAVKIPENSGLPEKTAGLHEEDTTQTVEIPEIAVQEIVKIAGKAHRGPIPDPESFERYEKTLPGAGDRILKMAEKEQEACLQQMPLDAKREFIGRITGQLAGVASLGLIIGCATAIALTANSNGAFVVAGALVATPLLAHAEKITNFFRRKDSE